MDDIIVGDRNGYITWFRRTGSGADDLTSEGHLSDASGVIDVGTNSAPVVVDWNNDGLLDLLVGNETTTQGIRLYLNSGTSSSPVLTTWTYIQSGGSDINRYRCCPQVYDLNGDGKKDLIMGENDAHIYYYENTGTDDSPAFNGFEALQSGGSPIDLYTGSRLWVDDWDSDGLPDLLVSDYDGFVYVYMAQDTGVEDFTSQGIESGFSVDPMVNPAAGAFSIKLHGAAGTSEITVYDGAGRAVANSSASSEMVTVDAGSLPAGVYTVVARNGSAVSTCRMVLTD